MMIEDGLVYRTRDTDPVGIVTEVEWPTNINGKLRIEHKWEARRPSQILNEVPVGTYPCFDTEREAAEWLASGRRG